MSEVHEGGCQCGAVRFRTTGAPFRAMACHCKTCKQRTGSVFGVGVYFRDEQVEFLQGELRTFEFTSDESGRWLRNEFCVRCGTAVSWTLEMRPGIRGMAGGAFDDPDWFDIEGHIWVRSARKDAAFPEGIPLHQEALPPGA